MKMFSFFQIESTIKSGKYWALYLTKTGEKVYHRRSIDNYNSPTPELSEGYWIVAKRDDAGWQVVVTNHTYNHRSNNAYHVCFDRYDQPHIPFLIEDPRNPNFRNFFGLHIAQGHSWIPRSICFQITGKLTIGKLEYTTHQQRVGGEYSNDEGTVECIQVVLTPEKPTPLPIIFRVHKGSWQDWSMNPEFPNETWIMSELKKAVAAYNENEYFAYEDYPKVNQKLVRGKKITLGLAKKYEAPDHLVSRIRRAFDNPYETMGSENDSALHFVLWSLQDHVSNKVKGKSYTQEGADVMSNAFPGLEFFQFGHASWDVFPAMYFELDVVVSSLDAGVVFQSSEPGGGDYVRFYENGYFVGRRKLTAEEKIQIGEKATADLNYVRNYGKE